MSRNVADVYSKLPGSVAVTGAVVDSSDYNDQIDDLTNAVNDVVMLSGSKPFTGDQSMGSHKLTSVTDGAAGQDAATTKQVQNAVVQHSTAVAGTADAIQVTFVPASTSLTTNEVIRWKSGGANTVVAPTISKDAGSTNKTIKKGAGAALAVGDTGASGYECVAIYNGTDWILQNPATTGAAVSASTTVRGDVELSTAAEFRNDTADRALTGEFVWDAAETVALTWTSGGNTAVDMATGINFTVAAASGNSTLGAPSNTKVGQTGFIRITQDSTPRTLAYHADWKFAGGADPVISTGSGAIDLLFYQVIAANFIYATLVKALA